MSQLSYLNGSRGLLCSSNDEGGIKDPRWHTTKSKSISYLALNHGKKMAKHVFAGKKGKGGEGGGN